MFSRNPTQKLVVLEPVYRVLIRFNLAQGNHACSIIQEEPHLLDPM